MEYANLAEIPFSEDKVAIALTTSPAGNTGHIGIAFYSSDKEPHVLHLAWHRELRKEAVSALKNSWIAAPLKIPSSASKQVAAYMQVVANHEYHINYGINLIDAMGSFAPDGTYTPSANSDGLTCATFVLEILRAQCIDLVDLGSWIAIPENIVWANLVCDSLEKYGADHIHIARVRGNINGLRLRPFEVAGAAQMGQKSWPCSFEGVQTSAANVEKQFLRILSAK